MPRVWDGSFSIRDQEKHITRKRKCQRTTQPKSGGGYRRAFFEDFDGQYYEVTLSIGNNGTTATVYNVGKVNGSVPPSAKLIAVVGSKPLGGTLPANSVEQESRNVNKQFSLSAARNTEEETAVGETVRQNLNKKGTNYLNGVERRLMNHIRPGKISKKEQIWWYGRI